MKWTENEAMERGNVANSQLMMDVEFTHFHLFCGLGAGARGFNKGTARVGNLRAKFRCIGGVDNDPAAIRDFGRMTGTPGTLIDMFDLDQYRAFHGRDPEPGWREATVEDIRRAAGYEFPDMVFLSAPCKGFSGLLPEQSSATAKYQALNRLTLRGVWLMLEAFKDDLPKLIIFENVPRIMTRGRALLNQIIALLRSYGYAVAETTHDCGEIGGLGQSRKRFLLVARHEEKVPPFLYEPEKRRLRGVGEILERLPLPGDPRGGPLHRMPALQWKTWVRLAFVEAGSDWRSLNKLAVEEGVLRDFGILPDAVWHDGALGVLPWDATSGVIKSKAEPTTGRFSVADVRAFSRREGTGFLGVNAWDESTGVISGNGRPGAGAYSVADPRVDGHPKSAQLGVRRWDQTAAVVKGDVSVGTGPYAVADPTIPGMPFNNVYRIVPWSASSLAIAGPGGPAGGLAVADPRPAPRADYKQTKYRVTGYEESAGTVIAASSTGNGAFAVADPRTGWDEASAHGNKMAVSDWAEPGTTVTGARFGSGAGAVADPRQGIAHHPLCSVLKGGYCDFDCARDFPQPVPDPRPGYSDGAHQNILAVTDWEERAKTVTGARHVAGGALSVADPRPVGLNENREHYKTGGHYGVLPWEQHAGAVPAYGKYDRGPWSVADPRGGEGDETAGLPAPSDRLVAVIRALDGTWHRPFTTLELAALQSLFDPDDIAEGFILDGQSDSAWRERIGNAVPPDAAAAIAGVMGTTLLLAMTGATFTLSSQPIWVRPLAMALSIDQRGNIPNE